MAFRSLRGKFSKKSAFFKRFLKYDPSFSIFLKTFTKPLYPPGESNKLRPQKGPGLAGSVKGEDTVLPPRRRGRW